MYLHRARAVGLRPTVVALGPSNPSTPTDERRRGRSIRQGSAVFAVWAGEENDDMNAPITPTGGKPACSKHELLLALMDLTLYNEFVLSGPEPNEQLKAVRLHRGKFDKYCPACGKHTTWTALVTQQIEEKAKQEQPSKVSGSKENFGSIRYNWTEDFRLSIMCARDGRHYGEFHFKVLGPSVFDRMDHSAGKVSELGPTRLMKIGQWPSMSEFQLGDVSDFEDGMSKDQRRDFVRATHSSAHGFHVAACVYYRRVFERVLVEARDEYMAKHSLVNWPEFSAARTDERIRLLRDHLPRFMSEHPQLYSVLSLGVHELSDAECAEELPMLRSAIELIMRDRVTAKRQERERQDVAKLLAQTVDRHKGRR
jgi:hypothetical protein